MQAQRSRSDRRPWFQLGGFALWLLLAACSNPGASNDSTPSPAVNSKEADAKPIAPPDPAAQPVTAIVVGLKFPQNYKNVSGYLVGLMDSIAFKPLNDGSGRWSFPGLKPGRYDVIIEAQAAQANANPSSFGLRLNGVQVNANEVSYLRDLELPAHLTLTGKTSLSEGSNHAGIVISIPGTRIKTSSQTDGNFILDKVPKGIHELSLQFAGYHQGFIEAAGWDEQHPLPLVRLLAETESLTPGVQYKGPPLSQTQANQVTLYFQRPEAMNRYRISETADFANAGWEVYRSSLDMSFPTGGDRKVFVQFSRNEGQLSPVYTLDLPSAP